MKEIYLDESEEKLTVDEIQSFEKKIGKIFPNDFKNFYSNQMEDIQERNYLHIHLLR